MSASIPDVDKIDLNVFNTIIRKPFTLTDVYDAIDVKNRKDQKVMIVDDDPTLARLVDGALRAKGLETYVFSDPKEALNNYAKIKPDVVLTDYLMPGMTGLQMVGKMKEHGNGSTVAEKKW